MVRKWRVLFAVALGACVTLAYADPPTRVARLNHVSGAVSFAPMEAPEEWTQAALNRPLTSGDRLWTDSGSRAELHVGSTALRLAPLTSVEVLNLDDQTLQVRLAQGEINMRVRDLTRDEIVEVATPAGAVLIRQPGSYRVSTESQVDSSRVLVNFGQADVITPTQTATVPSSQAAVFSTQSGIAFEVAAYSNRGEFDRWSAQRDRHEDQVNATRYVSRDMTGYEDLDDHGSWRTLPQYGAVWVPTNIAPGWAPYRHGYWVWMSQWGWTWVDDAPWGFAPFHYGRWLWLDSYWAWAPGPRVRRPVYAPALVAFVGAAGFSGSMRSDAAVGWFPLGWREPYIPWYRASHAYVRNVNLAHVSTATNIDNMRNIHYANRNRPYAVTVVPQHAFVSARPIAQESISVAQAQLARAELMREKSPAEPIRASITAEPHAHRPPAQGAARHVVTVNPPANAAARDTPPLTQAGGWAPDERRVRGLTRERRDVGAAGNPAGGAATPATPVATLARPIAQTTHGAAPAASAPAAPSRQVQSQRDPSNDGRPTDSTAVRSSHEHAGRPPHVIAPPQGAASVREIQIARPTPAAPQAVAPIARPKAAAPEAWRSTQAPAQPYAGPMPHVIAPHQSPAPLREAQIPGPTPSAPQAVAPTARPPTAPPEAWRSRQAAPQPQAAAPVPHAPAGVAHRQDAAPRATPQQRENHPRGEHAPRGPREAPARIASPS